MNSQTNTTAEVEPIGAECLFLKSGLELIVAPKPRKTITKNQTTKTPKIKSCMLRVQEENLVNFNIEDDCAYLPLEIENKLEWEEDNFIKITALQKPFSFELFSQQLHAKSQNSLENQENSMLNHKFPTAICRVRFSKLIQPGHILLPLAIRLQCFIDLRTRILARFHETTIKTNFKPKKVTFSELRWFRHEY